MSAINVETTVGELVVERPARARVLEQWGIDYCCGGKRPLREACQAKGLDPATIARVLEAQDQAGPSQQAVDVAEMSLTELADHIEQTHHAYLRGELPRLAQIVQRVADVHGDRRPELRQVASIFHAFRQELMDHMGKEEQVLFPLVRQLEAAGEPQAFHCGSLANPIRVMEMEHDNAGNALEQMHELTDGYQPPADACNTYRVMLDALHHLEKDMHQHVHKENNALFPRALQYEASLQKA